jgi:hypothetical protein
MIVMVKEVISNKYIEKSFKTKELKFSDHFIFRSKDTNKLYSSERITELISNRTKYKYIVLRQSECLYNLVLFTSKREAIVIVFKDNSYVLVITFFPLRTKSLKKFIKKYGVVYDKV